MTHDSSMDGFQATSRRVFQACLAYTVASTLVWFYFVVTQNDGGILFRKYNMTPEDAVGIVVYFLFFWIFWSYLFYRLKRFLLKRLGMSPEELSSPRRPSPPSSSSSSSER